MAIALIIALKISSTFQPTPNIFDASYQVDPRITPRKGWPKWQKLADKLKSGRS